MTTPTNQGGEGRPGTPGAEDDAGTINIPQDQVHPALRDAAHPAQTATYNVTINGRQEQWPLDKLIAEAQTGAAGREAFQQAAETRKGAAKALAIQEDLEQVFKEGDIDAFRRIGAQMGVPGDQVEEIARTTFGTDDEDEDDEDVVNEYFEETSQAGTRGTRSRDDGPVDYSRLSPDVQRVLREAEKVRIDTIVKNALDKDEVVSYNMNAQTDSGRAAIRAYVDEKIRGRLNSFNGDFGDGTRILAEVLPEIREHLQALGTPGQRTHTGLGQAPGGGDTEVYPTKLPDHVPSSEGDAFEQSILETMAYHQAQAERGKS
jgi:hypothetical protein